jgi:two-component system response regulator
MSDSNPGELARRAVLIVEDDPDDEELALRALNKINIANEIVVVRDGAEALEYLFGTGAYSGRDAEELPEVILLDLKLPKVDGLEVLKRLRADQRTETVPVVILTSSDEQRDVVDSYKLGANSYVRKPVEFDEFMQAVEELGLYWLLLNQVPWGDKKS